MATNPYFTHGTAREQDLVETMTIEALKMYGNDVQYIPRSLASKDEILGEDRLSRFQHAYPIEMYFENVDNFGGQGSFIQKVGLMIEQTATLVVARKRWEQLIGIHGTTTIPTRPNEGDLIYFPMNNKFFEVTFVEHESVFYQTGALQVYDLKCELFEFSNEKT